MSYTDLAILSRRVRSVERARIAATLQYGAFQRMGVAGDILELTPRYIGELERVEGALKRQLPKAAAVGEAEDWLRAVVEHQHTTAGLGPTVLYVIGLLPPLNLFAGPAKVWKYLGMHVVEGHSVRIKRGEFAGFSSELRAYALQRIADPVVKNTESAYRSVYDARREHTLETHPPMREDCEFCQLALRKTVEHREGHAYTRERKAPSQDCANVGGIHWTDGHRHRDAMRFVAKLIWRDVWRVAHGRSTKVLASKD